MSVQGFDEGGIYFYPRFCNMRVVICSYAYYKRRVLHRTNNLRTGKSLPTQRSRGAPFEKTYLCDFGLFLCRCQSSIRVPVKDRHFTAHPLPRWCVGWGFSVALLASIIQKPEIAFDCHFENVEGFERVRR